MLKKKNNTLYLTYEDFNFILHAVASKVKELDEAYLHIDHLHPDSDDYVFLTNEFFNVNDLYRKLITTYVENENKKVKVIFK